MMCRTDFGGILELMKKMCSEKALFAARILGEEGRRRRKCRSLSLKGIAAEHYRTALYNTTCYYIYDMA